MTAEYRNRRRCRTNFVTHISSQAATAQMSASRMAVATFGSTSSTTSSSGSAMAATMILCFIYFTPPNLRER